MLSQAECIEVLRGADEAIGMLIEELSWLHKFAIEFRHCNPDLPNVQAFVLDAAGARQKAADALAWYRSALGMYALAAAREKAAAAPKRRPA